MHVRYSLFCIIMSNNEDRSNTEAPVAMSTVQFSSLMRAISTSSSAMETAMDRKLSLFKEDMERGQEEVADRIVKKARREPVPEFNKKGNQFQHSFNCRISEVLEDAQQEAKAVSDSVTGASITPPAQPLAKLEEVLKRGTSLVNERQKLIKMADRSPFGWGVVTEYQTDELATDKEDEKRMEKAEKLAEKRMEKRKSKNDKGTKKGPATGGGRFPYSRQTVQPYQPQGYDFTPFMPGHPARPGFPSGRPVGPCHNCGEWGHLKRTCVKPPQGGKYPLLESVGGEEYSEGSDVNGKVVKGGSDVMLGDERYWEVGSDNINVVKVKGRINARACFWRNQLQASEPVLRIVQNGYILPFRVVPDPYYSPNHRSAFENAGFVGNAISDLMSNGCLVQCDDVPHVCSPLLVVTSRVGKKRLVINLRYVNKLLYKDKFKYEDIRCALQLFEKGDYMFTFDLKSGYHHIDINVESQPFLGCEWAGKFYRFTVLPFGLATACYVFTKVLAEALGVCYI